MELNIKIPVIGAAKAIRKMKDRKKRHPIVAVKAKVNHNTIKVDVEEMATLLDIADAYRDEIKAKMQHKYGE